MQKFCVPDFYKGVQLKAIDDHKWLGFAINTQKRTATDFLPEKTRHIHSPANAGSWTLCASGFKSRLRRPPNKPSLSAGVAAATLKTGTEEEVEILHPRTADFEFPVRQLKDAKDPEILKIAVAACALAS